MSSVTITPLTAPPKAEAIAPHGEESSLYHWTRDEYHRMADAGLFDGSRVELLQGEVWKMSPQHRPHFRTIRAVAEALEMAFGDLFDVQQQAPLGLDSDSEPEPDVAVVAGSWADYEDHPVSADVKLVVEVSDSSLAKDRIKKASSYARAGIQDYWIVNLVDRQVEIYRDPSPEGAYQSILILGPTKSIAPLQAPNAEIHVVDLLPPAS